MYDAWLLCAFTELMSCLSGMVCCQANQCLTACCVSHSVAKLVLCLMALAFHVHGLVLCMVLPQSLSLLLPSWQDNVCCIEAVPAAAPLFGSASNS